MQLDIPFYPNHPTPSHPGGIHCVEMSLKMILGYFMPSRTFTLEELEVITGKAPEKATWEMAMTIWFVNHGFEIIRLTDFDYGQFQSEGTRYIKRAYGEEAAEWQEKNSDIRKAQQEVAEYIKKVKIIQKKPSVEDIVSKMKDGYLIRVMVDSSVLNDGKSYEGHSVVVNGFDDNFISFHDPGLPPLKNRRVSYSLFQAAMDSFGGEIDCIKKLQ